ncbi:MAG: very short patch repair endonuclease [Candidatus Nealsonbacteria bacterium]|nr:very short patch repair endonuclease [Candidatus Nealsonbacteria bacterium]
MADTLTKNKRSETMRAIKSKDSLMERKIRKELSKLGLRFRKNVSHLKGKPDLVFTKDKVAVFLDSCFWHGCKKHCRVPSSNKIYWKKKIERNRQRDAEITRSLKKDGWRVIRFWEHNLKANQEKCLAQIKRAIK